MIDVLGGISNPLLESGAVGAVGLLSLAFKRFRTGIGLIVAAGAWVYLCATPTFSLVMWRGLVHQNPPQAVTAYPRAGAIVLVGGGSVPRPLGQWNAATDPALSTPLGFALALYQAGKAPVFVATGDYGHDRFARTLVRQGMPRAALRLEPGSRTTHEDAEDARLALPTRDDDTILLVATAMHMPRTVAAFQRLGFDVIPAPAQQPAWLERWPRSLAPTRSALDLSRSCLHEYLGLLYYRLRGWATW